MEASLETAYALRRTIQHAELEVPVKFSNSRSNGYRGGLSANNPSILEMRGSKLRFADPSYRLPQFQVTFYGSELQADTAPSYVLLIQVTGCRA